MSFRRILVTGGSGFVGSTISLGIKKQWPNCDVLAFDNLRRRGSESLLPRLAAAGVTFLHGDVRNKQDFPDEPFDLLVECSAEASVMAGYTSSPTYLLDTNIQGVINCLDYCRRYSAGMVFLSTSRVYSIEPLCRLNLTETLLRFELDGNQTIQGAGISGISEDFPTGRYRSLYGTTKLAAEMIIEEYRRAYALKAVINRCGVLAGPWQMARSDQGIFTFWMANHFFKRPLAYIGFGGSGKQVRDLLHPEDLTRLVCEQISNLDAWDGEVVNVGGGPVNSLSLKEATSLCAKISGNEIPITRSLEARPMDIPVYVSDCRKLHAKTKWRPARVPEDILVEIYEWINAHQETFRHII